MSSSSSDQKFSSSITSCTNILLVKARERPSGDGTMLETHPEPEGISCNTLGLPFASMARMAVEEADCASANKLLLSAAQLICDKNCHFHSRTGRVVKRRLAKFRIFMSPLSFLSSTTAIQAPSGERSQRGSGA